MIIGRNFAEKLYSANEYYEDEKLYSTGDSDLDNLLEKAFCDGYEYAQKEFARKDYEKEKEAKMQLAREILEAEEKNDSREAKYLKKKFVENDRKLKTRAGAITGGIIGSGFIPGLGTGIGAAAGGAIGHGIGRKISNDSLDEYLRAAKKEKEAKNK